MTAALGLTAESANLITNGDFEDRAEDFVVRPGYVGGKIGTLTNPSSIPGWAHEGNVGINPSGPGADDSPFDDPSNTSTGAFAFVQGTASISQFIGGFSVGESYTLTLDVNARDCCGDFPLALVSLDDTVIGSSTEVFPEPGGVIPTGADDPWYNFYIPFVATAESHTLTFSTMPATGGDSTLVLDNLSIKAVPEPSAAMLALSAFGLLVFLRRRA